MELLFHVGLPANHSVHGLFFPHESFLTGSFVDVVRAGGFNALKYFAQRPEDWFSFFVLFLDLRLEEQMDVVRHHARGEELILTMMVGVENAFHYYVAFGRS